MTDSIAGRVAEVLNELPAGVTLVAAAKARSPEEIAEAIRAGVSAIGDNYVQQARQHIAGLDPGLRARVRWHLIGHLQRNKAKVAAQIFDMIETVDSAALAAALDRHCAAIGRVMPVLIEVNSGREASKSGVLPEDTEALAREVSGLGSLRLMGLMTMGPRFGDPEDARPYFVETKAQFDRLAAAGLPKVEMRYLSMGMSNSYRVAIEEGANLVRIGTRLFGHREDEDA
ncbi:alanine racemase [candidate division KD3-62 bacterium DG_56]|uniref:Pyridoxal phosphate homeostasis protein n=1 Tax=candidate division KD3-62 bacterium DG_56 TaxID=1704032 RepID=A0A0S7XP22_9BACT|nr:MAG: alanine racemase [candidate division KD3-62 bacterium DG_56]